MLQVCVHQQKKERLIRSKILRCSNQSEFVHYCELPKELKNYLDEYYEKYLSQSTVLIK